jgi:hypothetical protein
MILRQVALVSETASVGISDLTQTSAALQKQATRDFGPIWDVQATVDAFDKLEHVPVGYWPILIRDDIGQPGAAGIHLDKDNQPFALVQFSDTWQLTTSHEMLEMLADPFGNRVMAGDSPKPDQGRVEFLVEVCDPSEGAEFGYTVNGILLSDFYTPNYFDPVVAPGVRYSYTGAITEPRQVLRGGYLSWHDLVSDHWWQEIFFDDAPEFRDIGILTQKAGSSLRALVDRITEAESRKSMVRNKTRLLQAAGAFARHVARPSSSKADAWHAQIEALKSGGAESSQRRSPRRGRATEPEPATEPELERRRPPRLGQPED